MKDKKLYKILKTYKIIKMRLDWERIKSIPEDPLWGPIWGMWPCNRKGKLIRLL